MFTYVRDETQYELVEYACHEGNYGMPNILTGARAREQEPITKRGHARTTTPAHKNTNSGAKKKKSQKGPKTDLLQKACVLLSNVDRALAAPTRERRDHHEPPCLRIRLAGRRATRGAGFIGYKE